MSQVGPVPLKRGSGWRRLHQVRASGSFTTSRDRRPTRGTSMHYKIELRTVYKIFGDQPPGRALELAGPAYPRTTFRRSPTTSSASPTSTSRSVEGEIFVVMGLSGSGKSTAIRTVNKLPSHGGEVFVDGDRRPEAERAAPSRHSGERRWAWSSSTSRSFPHRTVIDNVGYGLEVQGWTRPTETTPPQGPRAGRSRAATPTTIPHELSGGMQQRVGLAGRSPPTPTSCSWTRPSARSTR